MKALDVGDHLVGQIALVLALLDVRAVEALHVVLVEDRRQRLDGLQVGLQLRQRLLVQHLGVRGGLVDVVLEDVPAGKDQVVQVGQRHKVLDQRRFVVGALAQADGAHLRQRSDRLGQSAADGLDSGDHGGGDGAQADHHHAQFARCGRNLRAAVFWPPCSSVPIVSPNLVLLAPDFRAVQISFGRRNSARLARPRLSLLGACLPARFRCDQTNHTIPASSASSTAR